MPDKQKVFQIWLENKIISSESITSEELVDIYFEHT
jgi:hypothetical protein